MYAPADPCRLNCVIITNRLVADEVLATYLAIAILCFISDTEKTSKISWVWNPLFSGFNLWSHVSYCVVVNNTYHRNPKHMNIFFPFRAGSI